MEDESNETRIDIHSLSDAPPDQTRSSSSLGERFLPNSFVAKKMTDEQLNEIKSKDVKTFYKHQNELVDMLIQAYNVSEWNRLPLDESEEADAPTTAKEKIDFKIKVAIYGSMLVNCLLLVLKLAAVVESFSLSIIAAALDSLLDLLSGSIIFITSIIAAKRNKYKYPVGRSRLEPVGIITFSAVMFTATLQLFVRAVETLLVGGHVVVFGIVTMVAVVCTIVLKTALMCYCYTLKERSASVSALFEDHRNDVLSNTFGTLAVLGAVYYRPWIDPVGAIIIGLYICTVWVKTGYEQISVLTARGASSEFLNQLTFMAMHHDERIVAVDTVRAFHASYLYLVEVDIVLDPDMPLKEAHDIGESLQNRIEALETVERAFVHLDYEYQHKPEHKTTEDVAG